VKIPEGGRRHKVLCYDKKTNNRIFEFLKPVDIRVQKSALPIRDFVLNIYTDTSEFYFCIGGIN
jgi:hypothetical protein